MPHPALRRTLTAIAVAVACAVCAACSVPASTAAAPALRTSSDLGAIQVTGSTGGTPKVSVPTPFSVPASARRLLTRGTGPLVQPGQRVTVDYLGINGTDGHQILSSYGSASPSFVLDPKQAMPGIVTSLVGVPVGSRVLAALAPKDAYGVQGQPAAGIGPTDTIVVLLDVKAAHTVLQRATGTPVAPKPGLPRVTRPRVGPAHDHAAQGGPAGRARRPAARARARGEGPPGPAVARAVRRRHLAGRPRVRLVVASRRGGADSRSAAGRSSAGSTGG